MQMKVDSEEHLSSKISDLIFFLFLFCLVNLRSEFDQSVTIILLVKNVCLFTFDNNIVVLSLL